MLPKKKLLLKKLSKGALYCITSARKDIDAFSQVVKAVRGGADIIQYRDKTSADGDFLKTAARIAEYLKPFPVPFIVNDRLELAVRAGADGFHIGDNETEFGYARRIARKYGLALGISSHGVRDALGKERFADYLGFGPVFDTPNKKNHSLLGLCEIAEAVKQIKKPFVAIGGIDINCISDVVNAGAVSVAVLRAACGAKDIEKSSSLLKKKMEKCLLNLKKNQNAG